MKHYITTQVQIKQVWQTPTLFNLTDFEATAGGVATDFGECSLGDSVLSQSYAPTTSGNIPACPD